MHGSVRQEGSPWPVALAATVALAAALALLAPALAVPLPAVALYHRLHRDAALNNPVRSRLYEAVATRPGITIQDAAEHVGIARTTAAYHLRILGREGLVIERPSRKTVHYYRNDGRLSEALQFRLQALASRRTRDVAEVVAKTPGLQRSELATLLGISIATVNWHLRPLSERGLLREELRGRRRLLFPTEALGEALGVLTNEGALPSSPMPQPASAFVAPQSPLDLPPAE